MTHKDLIKNNNEVQGANVPSVSDIIKAMELKPLPEEGGYYRETYRSDYGSNAGNIFGLDTSEMRDLNTAIYYLISEESFSALHRITSDEIFHFYKGDPVQMIQIDPEGNLSTMIMGPNILEGQMPQVVVPRNHWQALKVIQGGQWALMGTTVAPGFDFNDFEVAPRDHLLKLFPQHQETIVQFTR